MSLILWLLQTAGCQLTNWLRIIIIIESMDISKLRWRCNAGRSHQKAAILEARNADRREGGIGCQPHNHWTSPICFGTCQDWWDATQKDPWVVSSECLHWGLLSHPDSWSDLRSDRAARVEAERLQTLVDERVKEPMQHVQRFEISRTWNDNGQVFNNFSQPSSAVLPERSGVVNLLNRSHLKLLKKLPSLSGLIEPRGGRRWPSMSMRCGRPFGPCRNS